MLALLILLDSHVSLNGCNLRCRLLENFDVLHDREKAKLSIYERTNTILKTVYMLLRYFINKTGKLQSHFEHIYFPKEFFVTLHTSMALKLIYGRYMSIITKLITLLTMLFRFRNYSPLYVAPHPPKKKKSNTSCRF
jgi:hypothetical protein